MNNERAVEIFSRLVAFDTTSDQSNLPIADFISDMVERNADAIARVPSEDGTKTNLLVRFGTAADRQGLILSGHMDCVPAREEGWESDPFTLTDRGDRWVGRGASDMKGFLALSLALAEELDTRMLRHPLYLLFTYDEEVGTLGAHRFSRVFDSPETLPRNVIIGEPTSLKVARMHKGHLKLRITTLGKSAHSGYPHLGRNAIEAAGHVIARLSAVREELMSERPPHSEHFEGVPFAALNVGTIRGGSAVNVIPDRCALELGIRLLPGMPTGSMIERVESALSELHDDEWRLEMISDSPPMLLDEETPIVQTLTRMVEQHETATVSFATDAGWLQTLGLHCVLFGPGSIEVAHRPNEFMPKGEFFRAAEWIARAIRHFCIEEERA